MNWSEPMLSHVRRYLSGDDSALNPLWLAFQSGVRSRYRSVQHWLEQGRNYKATDGPTTPPGPWDISVRIISGR